MFESAANLDAGEKEEDRHFVADLDILLNYADEEEEGAGLTPEQREAQRLQDIADMRIMAAMVNEAMGGEG